MTCSIQAQYETATINKLRRELAAGLIGDDDTSPMVASARLFDERLLGAGRWVFDAMVARSLRIVREHPAVGRLFASRHSWLVVDEYQDLGPVLHALVLALHDAAGVSIAAFGDPDQSVMGFTGADPRYLNELAARGDFRDHFLGVNYRCGQAIVAASHTALREPRTYRAVPGRADDGAIEPIMADGGLDEHAAIVAGTIDALLTSGVAGHDIAVLYPARGPLLSALIDEFDARRIPYVNERDERLPSGELARLRSRLRGPRRRRTSAGCTGPGRRCDLRRHLGRPGTGIRSGARSRRAATARPSCRRPKVRRPAQRFAVGRTGSSAVRDQQALGKFREAASAYGLEVRDIAAGVEGRQGHVDHLPFREGPGMGCRDPAGAGRRHHARSSVVDAVARAPRAQPGSTGSGPAFVLRRAHPGQASPCAGLRFVLGDRLGFEERIRGFPVRSRRSSAPGCGMRTNPRRGPVVRGSPLRSRSRSSRGRRW